LSIVLWRLLIPSSANYNQIISNNMPTKTPEKEDPTHLF